MQIDMSREPQIDGKLEERSNSFFDENDEERILTELNNNRPQGPNYNQSINNTGALRHATGAASSFGRPQQPNLMSTEQFMRDMGVVGSTIGAEGEAAQAVP